MLKVVYNTFSTGRIYGITLNDRLINWGYFLEQLELSETFRTLVSSLLTMDGRDYFLKLPPLFNRETPFYILLIFHAFTEKADFSSFRDKLTKPLINVFNNTDNTAILVVPSPKDDKDYLTLYRFLLNSSLVQQTAFYLAWVRTARLFLKDNVPVWINTHGLGVPWLHLRFDLLFKYPDLPFAVPQTLDLAPWLKFGREQLPTLL